MDKIPFPKSRAGWYVALVVIAGLFYIYYFCLYGSLSSENVKFLWSSSEPVIINKQVEVKIYSPEFVSNFEFEDLQIKVFNRSETGTADVKILLAQNNNDVIVTLRLDGEDIELPQGSQKTITFGEILPTDTMVQTVGIKTRQASGNLDFVFSAVLDGKIYDQVIPVSRPVVDHYSVLIHMFLRNILLPPWSNGFIPVLVLFTIYLLEDRIKKGKPLRKIIPFLNAKRKIRLIRWISEIPLLISPRSWLAVIFVNTVIVLLFYGWVMMNSFKPAALLVGVGCLISLRLARRIAGKPEKQDDDFYCGLNCTEPEPHSPPVTPIKQSEPLSSVSQSNQNNGGVEEQDFESDRSVLEKLNDFEPIVDKHHWLHAFHAISEPNSFQRDDAHAVQAFLEKGRGKNFPGYPLVERLESEDRQHLIDMGVELSKLDPGFADFFIYKELCYLPDSLNGFFLEKIREIGTALKKSPTSGLSDRLDRLIYYDWQNKLEQLPQKQPSNFARKFAKAVSAQSG